MVQLNTLVAVVQAVLLLASSLPLRIFQIEDKLHLFYLEKCSVAENRDKYYCGFHRDNYHPVIKCFVQDNSYRDVIIGCGY